MHENKFRAWDTITKKMEYFDLDDLVWNFDAGYFVGYDLSFNPLLKTSILMQNTDLKDKTGKEIYEGDIVSGIFRKGVIGLNDITLGKVMFYSPSFYICPPSENKFIMPFNDNVLVDKDTNYEIIGNIYENPELLK